MKHFWQKTRGLTSSNFHKINWDAIHSAGKEVTKSRRQWITKHAAGFCGVNAVLLKWKKRQNSICPRCGQVETSQHVWKCNGKNSKELWLSSIDKLVEWLQSMHTDPSITTAIKNNLQNWLLDLPQNNPRSALELAQDELGWDYFVEGHLSSKWSDSQESYYKAINKSNTGKRWLTELIKKLWNIAWDIWTYRNGIAAEDNKKATHTLLDQQISQAWQQTPTQTVAQHLYTMATKQQLISATKGTKRNWLTAHSAQINLQIKNQKQKLEIQQLQTYMSKYIKSR
jgi:hypothetical protein